MKQDDAGLFSRDMRWASLVSCRSIVASLGSCGSTTNSVFRIGATATNIKTLIGASVFIGTATSVQLAYPVIIGELVPIKDRGYWYAVTLVPVIPFAFFGAFLGRSQQETFLTATRPLI